MPENSYNPWLHRLALATTIATFPLIFMGGLVTSHGAGMSVPDWPNSYGYNMFTFPPSQWIGGIFYEHTHRLMGTVVGMLSIALAIAAWMLETRRWARWLAYGVLATVIFQGVLGGLRVVLVELDLAIVHACFAQAFFCLAALVWVITSRGWHERDTGFQPVQNSIVALAILCVVAIYLQLIVGAMMRHYNAGLAIPDLPLHYGNWLPPISQAGLDAVNQQRAWEWHLPRVSMLQVWLHFGHRIGAVIVSLLLIALIVRAWRDKTLRSPAIAIAGLLVTQLTLGVLTVLMKKPADIASLHVAVGALVLVSTFVLMVRAARLHGFQTWHELPARANDLTSGTHGLVARATI